MHWHMWIVMYLITGKDEQFAFKRALSRLREMMMNAAADDEQSNREKIPATAKLRMLPQVMDVLRKCVLTLTRLHRTAFLLAYTVLP